MDVIIIIIIIFSLNNFFFQKKKGRQEQRGVDGFSRFLPINASQSPIANAVLHKIQKPQKFELYDLKTDPFELKDLSQESKRNNDIQRLLMLLNEFRKVNFAILFLIFK